MNSRSTPSTVDGVVPAWLCGAAVVFFLIYATNFLYFFVDDEAIPYVYAQNLLHGLGLAYNAIEGRVEGYSDFLHVWWSTLILAFVNLVHLPKIAVFFIGKAFSLAAGAGVIVGLTALLRVLRTGRVAAVTTLAVAALAGPLALWSASSLETVPFTLGCVVLVWTLVTARHAAAAVVGALLLLLRIDGFIYVGTLVASFALVADAARRRAMVKIVVLPLTAVFAGYHAWRWWYFGDLLPAPVASKVLYKLLPAENVVVKPAAEAYWRHVIDVYGWPALALAAGAVVQSLRMGGVARAVAIAATVMLLYAGFVGDWMFGLRFFVPAIPIAALMFGLCLDRIAVRRATAAAAVAVGAVVWSGFAAGRFLHAYQDAEVMDGFLTHPSADLHRFFWPYYGLYEELQPRVRPGDVIAYNQAGFVPFMLDLNNIDDLGICSRFFARMPTTDVFFTEVGRYEPLTNRKPLRAGEAYLLHRKVQFVLARTDLLRHANDDAIPDYVLDGYYRLIGTDRAGENAIYERTDKPADVFRASAAAFPENLAHVSRIRSASINGATIDQRALSDRLPFFRDARGSITYNGEMLLNVVLGKEDAAVFELVAADVHVSEPSTLTLTLWSSQERPVHQARLELTAGEPHAIDVILPSDIAANRLVIEVMSTPQVKATVRFTDVRVQGQSPALAEYIARTLTFRSGDRHQF